MHIQWNSLSLIYMLGYSKLRDIYILFIARVDYGLRKETGRRSGANTIVYTVMFLRIQRCRNESDRVLK